MNIPDLKLLEQLIKLCRKTGIDAMELGDLKFNLGPEPKAKSRVKLRSVSEDFPEASIKIPQFNISGGGAVGSTLEGTNTTYTIHASNADAIKTDELTPEQLMFYSSGDQQTQTGD